MRMSDARKAFITFVLSQFLFFLSFSFLANVLGIMQCAHGPKNSHFVKFSIYTIGFFFKIKDFLKDKNT